MATAQLIPGSRFRLYRAVGSDYAFVALATTLSLTTGTAFEDHSELNGSWWREARPGLRSWSLQFAGVADVQIFPWIEADEASSQPQPYRITIAMGDPRSYSGALYYEKLSRGMSDRGFVTFQATCRGNGPLIIE